jgi:uncharacterized membrane protein
MSEAIPAVRTHPAQSMEVLPTLGKIIFSLANIALGAETLLLARHATHALGPRYEVIPVIPWLPAISWLAYLFGAIWIACGVGLLFPRTVRAAALLLGSLLFLCTLILEVPKNAANFGSMSLRTGVFEPLSLACIAWLLPRRGAFSNVLVRSAQILLALSLIVFGVDHFLGLAFIASLIPSWIPWRVFWVAFFGAAFIAAGLGFALNYLQRWGALGIGAMFGIWVFTLHLPRVLGLYGIPGAPHNPNEWSSLFIAVALWGGLWALARNQTS